MTVADTNQRAYSPRPGPCGPSCRAQSGGTIVNISSLAAVDPFPGFSLYGASKAWVELFTRATADEGRGIGIRAFAVRLGAVDTPLLRGLFPEFPARKRAVPRGCRGIHLRVDDTIRDAIHIGQRDYRAHADHRHDEDAAALMQLTREVRCWLAPGPSPTSSPVVNSWSGWPCVDQLVPFLVVRVTVAGSSACSNGHDLRHP